MSERHAYFFTGARYLRYNIDTDLVDVGPVEISTFWTHLPQEFQSKLEAVVNWGRRPRLLQFERPQSASQKVNARRANTQSALNAYRRDHP